MISPLFAVVGTEVMLFWGFDALEKALPKLRCCTAKEEVHANDEEEDSKGGDIELEIVANPVVMVEKTKLN